MRNNRLRTVAAVALLLCGATVGWAEPKTWEFSGGQWPEVKSPTTVPASEPVLDQAEQFLYHHNWRNARSMILRWEKQNKHSPVRDRALYLLADAYYQKGDRIYAFYYLDELLDEYPDSRLFYPALEKQHQIADAFLNGYKRRFLFMPILDASDEGIEMLYRIQQRSPGSPLAERALIRTADWYYNNAEYDVAGDAYNAYARSYPRSPEIPRVKLRAAFSSLAQFRGLRFDPTAILDARSQLVDIEHNYPQLAQEENVASVIEQLDSAFARKILLTGQYYERVHEPKGAVYHYRYLVETYPDSAEAKQAKDRLAKMPPSALTDPPPPAGTGYAPGPAYAPTTQPAGETDTGPVITPPIPRGSTNGPAEQ